VKTPSGRESLQAVPPSHATRYAVLGPLEVRQDNRPVAVRGPQERALLALLLTSPGRVFSVASIVDGLWGDHPPAGADRTVQQYVSRLRRSLPDEGRPAVVTRPPGYLIDADPDDVDAEQFRRLVDRGRRELAGDRPESAAVTCGRHSGCGAERRTASSHRRRSRQVSGPRWRSCGWSPQRTGSQQIWQPGRVLSSSARSKGC